jgi:membrane-anchored protein YejM (alkaline phosphatase superfamily)
VLGRGGPPRNNERPGSLTEERDTSRQGLRATLDDRFLLQRRTAATEAYTRTWDQALRLMDRREVFDASKEPQRVQERYGDHDFGRHCLLARRMLEEDVRFVQVNHSNYDTHNENFNFHLEQLAEFDQGFSTLLEDLDQRGLLESTLVVVMSEFGRTPRINQYYGRDHWSKAWSVALAGCGIQRGAVIGKTNADGTAVDDREVHHGHLFHTYLRAVGVDSSGDFAVGGTKLPVANPADEPISELLA